MKVLRKHIVFLPTNVQNTQNARSVLSGLACKNAFDSQATLLEHHVSAAQVLQLRYIFAAGLRAQGHLCAPNAADVAELAQVMLQPQVLALSFARDL